MIDSLTKKLEEDSAHTYRFKKLRPYLNIDSRNSFNRVNPTSFSGLQYGVRVNEFHTFGMGLYTLTKFSFNNTPIDAILKINRLGYINVFYEYMLLNKKYFRITFPFEIGVGGFQGQLQDTLSQGINISKLIMPMGASAKFIVKPVRWFGISSMIGYQYIPYRQTLINYDGLYYSLGIWIDFRLIYRDVKYFKFQKKKYRRAVKSVLAT
ncbi:MAG: hypothetical protein Q7W45_15755 [Bacteroidota bacterium]|nr:hypothetical protein [Bacteroidota bacterium]MDP3145530.1 hypothetical protein [Bacteroidota bacterium]MDP3556490.1 hypothetical protein [Bacteroidota bacterium]